MCPYHGSGIRGAEVKKKKRNSGGGGAFQKKP